MSEEFNIREYRIISKDGAVGYKIFNINYLLSFRKPKTDYEFIIKEIIGREAPLTPIIRLNQTKISNLTNNRTDAYHKIWSVLENKIDKDRLLSFLNEVAIDLEALPSDTWKKEEIKKEEAFIITEKEKEEALILLNAPDLLERVIKLLSEVVVGENKNKIIAFLIALSGQTDDKQILIFKAKSTAGKTHLANAVLEPIGERVWKVGRYSKTAIDYKEDWDLFDVIYLQEMSEQESETHVRLISTRDGGFKIAITIMVDGVPKVYEKEVPPKTVVITSTEYELDEQLETRAVFINMDESEAQTGRIIDHKTQRHKDDIKEVLGLKDDTPVLRILYTAVKMLKPCKVFVPYIDALKDVFNKKILRVRADFDKFIALIKLSAYLHQYQRYTKDLENGTRLVFATLQDLEYIKELADEILLSTVSGMDKRVKQCYEVVCNLITEIDAENDNLQADAVNDENVTYIPKERDVTVEEVAIEMSPLSQERVYKILKALMNRGKLLKTKKSGEGNKNFYYIPPEQSAIGSLRIEVPEDPTLEECILKTLEDFSPLIDSQEICPLITEKVAKSTFFEEITADTSTENEELLAKEKRKPPAPTQKTDDSPKGTTKMDIFIKKTEGGLSE